MKNSFPGFDRAILQNLTIWYIWAGMSFFISRMEKKYPIDNSNRAKHLPINLAISFLLASLHVILYYSILTLILFIRTGNLVLEVTIVRVLMSSMIYKNILIYFMIFFFCSTDKFSLLSTKLRKKISMPEFLQLHKNTPINNSDHASYMQRLLIKTKQRIIPLDVNSIQRIEVAGSYLDIYTDERQYLYRSSLREMTENLDPEKFMRISRSCLVNLESIKELEKYFNGRYLVVLKNGAKLKVSLKYNHYVINRLIK
jgi:hypothetical protein